MIKKNILKLFPMLPQIIASLFLAGAVVLAAPWQGPTNTPPLANADAPINTGTSTQYKKGGFGIGGLFETDINTHLGIISGKVGIGTQNPSEKLEVNGYIKVIEGIIFSDGTVLRTAAIPTGATFDQVFASSGTFTVPLGVTKLWVTIVGGGGGGGGMAYNDGECSNGVLASGGGGGAGEVISITLDVTERELIPVVVGGGGNGGQEGFWFRSVSGSDGSPGGNSFFGLFAAKGGQGGGRAGGNWIECWPAPGAGGSIGGSDGSQNYYGNPVPVGGPGYSGYGGGGTGGGYYSHNQPQGAGNGNPGVGGMVKVRW